MSFLDAPSPEDIEMEQIIADPQVGDRFHEMYHFYGYVVARSGDSVAIMTASVPCAFPEDGELAHHTVGSLREYLSYNGIPGYWVTSGGRGHNVAGWFLGESL